MSYVHTVTPIMKVIIMFNTHILKNILKNQNKLNEGDGEVKM